MRLPFAVVICLQMVLSCTAMAQADERLRFEVASIKPAAPDARGMFIRPGPGGGVSITNMPLKEMIVLAWHVQPFQISGGPAWLDSVHYDIIAKPEARPSKQADISIMLQTLLEDRFQLAIHRETKELSILALVMARKDRRLGPRLAESKEGACAPIDPSKPPPPLEPGKPPALGCGGMMMSPMGLNAVGVTVASLAPMFSRLLGTTVVDKTNLPGNFDIRMEWAPDGAPAFGQLPPGQPAPPTDAGPSIFTALQEQLGLKLESQKGPVEILVIDRAEKPSEN